MPKGYYKDVTAMLKENNCILIRQKGSHQFWLNQNTQKSFTVSTNLKSRHTANAIMKQAGINYRFR
jgi:predicted RNA binding protein YcfA (HicA-like mRNA interferase family)